MNKFKYYFIVLVTSLSLFSCSKDNPTETIPMKEYSVQYTTDIATIEEYLKTTYFTITNHPGFADDQDVTFTNIPSGGTQASVWSYLNSTSFPKLLSRDVKLHDITYKVYYLVLREGTGEKPTNVDGVLASYKGNYLTKTAATTTVAATLTATQFEESKNPQSFFGLTNTIVGWSEIFPQFKKGTYASNADGTVSYSNFGAGVMFLPSGLAYYGSGSGTIPAYSPLVFSFKLYEIQRSDIDADGIPSYLEDLNGDGYMYDFRNTTNYPTAITSNSDDTDADGIPNYLDVDDDGDNYTTKLEIKDPISGSSISFALIPDCSGNTTNATRVKKHLDKNCH
jgi:hypothetical protein